MSSLRSRTIRHRAVAGALALCLAAAACGDDDTTEAAGDDTPSTDAYCDVASAVNEQDGPPTDEQIGQLKDLAPEEISDDVASVADAIAAADGDLGKALGDDGISAALDRIDAYDVDTCGIEAGDEGGEDDGAAGDIDPAFAEYCAASAALDESEEAPTPEQFEELRTLAPDEISEEADIVVDALIASDFDFGTTFADPEVSAAVERIEAFEVESCGASPDEGDDEEDALVLEPTPGATLVPVSGVDFAFDGIPAEIPAGPVSFAFDNDGESAHEMFVARIGDGFTLDELLALDSEPTEEQAEEIGGTFGSPGDPTSYVNGDLEPGTYAVVCFIPGPGGKPHYELGMKTSFTVS